MEVRIFRGITFARCRRFEKAELVRSDKDSGEENSYGTILPQPLRVRSSAAGHGDVPEMDENRLCLTIYTPENAHNLPVMVWIHGGSFLVGGSEERRYSGERLSRTGNLVVVKISYRLGVFGYLWDAEKKIGNLGLDDQRKALLWIKENISRFGGDPDNVCLFGQSAGAYSIACLISEKNPFFRRAILQSPPLGLTNSEEEAERTSRKFIRRLEKETGKTIFDASVEEMLTAQSHFTKNRMKMRFMPVKKGLLPPDSKDFAPELVIGHTAEETAPYIYRIIGRAVRSPLGKKIEHHFTDSIFTSPTDLYVRALKAGGVQVTTYLIDRHPAGSPLGSCHCMELPFILGEYENWKDSSILYGMSREEYDRISKSYLKAWTDFANGIGFNSSLL